MKRKTTIIIILLSLFLNIIHDFVVLKESKDSCEVSTLLLENSIEQSCCKKTIELHKTFHFVAILSHLKILFLEDKLSIFSNSRVSTQLLSFDLFKPPQI